MNKKRFSEWMYLKETVDRPLNDPGMPSREEMMGGQAQAAPVNQQQLPKWQATTPGAEQKLGKGMIQATGARAVNVKGQFADKLGWAIGKLAASHLRTMGRKQFIRQILAATKQIIDDPMLMSNPRNMDPSGGRVNFNQGYQGAQNPSVN